MKFSILQLSIVTLLLGGNVNADVKCLEVEGDHWGGICCNNKEGEKCCLADPDWDDKTSTYVPGQTSKKQCHPNYAKSGFGGGDNQNCKTEQCSKTAVIDCDANNNVPIPAVFTITSNPNIQEVDPNNPNTDYIFYKDTGTQVIFPGEYNEDPVQPYSSDPPTNSIPQVYKKQLRNGVGFLFRQNPSADPDAWKVCPPRECRFLRGKTNDGYSGNCDNSNMNANELDTDSPRNGQLVKQEWGVASIGTSENIPFFPDGKFYCLECQFGKGGGTKVKSNLIKMYFVDVCIHKYWMSSKHSTFLNTQTEYVAGERTLRYVLNQQAGGTAQVVKVQFQKTDMFTDQSGVWDLTKSAVPCTIASCDVKLDDNYDIRSFITGIHGMEYDHGTFSGYGVADGYITHDPDWQNFPGAKIKLNEITADTTYELEIKTDTAFSYPNIYIKCETDRQGMSKYRTLHGSKPFGIIDPEDTLERWMGPFQIDVLPVDCGFYVQITRKEYAGDTAVPSINGILNEVVSWTEQNIDVVFAKTTASNFETFDFATNNIPFMFKKSDGTMLGGTLNDNFIRTITNQQNVALDPSCFIEEYESYTDQALSTILNDNTNIEMENKNTIVNTQYKVQTQNTMCRDVYINAFTPGFIQTTLPNVKVSLLTSNIGINDKTNNGVKMTFIVCGNEVVSNTPAASTLIEYLGILQDATNLVQAPENYVSWFTVTFPTTVPGCSHSSCTIDTYWLGGCYTPGYANTKYDNLANFPIMMPETPSTTTNAQITIKRDKPFVEKVCMWAKTRGGSQNIVGREINYEVCGTEEVIITNPDTYSYTYLYRTPTLNLGGQRHAVQDITSHRLQFSSPSSNCAITEWELFNSDGTTPLTDPNIIIQGGGTQLAINSENWNWSKTIKLKNKLLNPIGPNSGCNWQCYKDRYQTELSGMASLEEVKQYWISTDEPGGSRICTCDEVQTITLNLDICCCDLVPVFHNTLMPGTMPTLADYRLEQQIARWFIFSQVSIIQPQHSHHPQYWLDMFYSPISPTFSVDKDMTDRFRSDDQINCPLTQYFITEVYDDNGDPVLPSVWNLIMSIGLNTGLMSVFNFQQVRKNWKIHLGGQNDLQTASSSPHYVVDFTTYVPFVPENEKPYIKDLKQYHELTAYKNETWYSFPQRFNDTNYFEYIIPEPVDPENEGWTLTILSGLQPYISFDPTTRKITVHKDKIPAEAKLGYFVQDTIRFQIQDFYGQQLPNKDGNIVYYTTRFDITIPINQPPSFVTPHQLNHTIPIYKNSSWYDRPREYKDYPQYNYTFPKFFDPENETVSLSFPEYENSDYAGFNSSYMSYDEEIRNIKINKTQVKRWSNRGEEQFTEYMIVPLILSDSEGNKATYQINLQFVWLEDRQYLYDMSGKNFTANITEISETGLVKVMFSTFVEKRYFNITKHEDYDFRRLQEFTGNVTHEIQVRPHFNSLNVSDLNSTYLELFVIPANDRHMNSGYDIKVLNFTWECVFYDFNFMLIQLNFTNASQISPEMEWDTLFLRFKPEKVNYWFSDELNEQLSSDHQTLWHKIQPQMYNDTKFSNFLKILAKTLKVFLTGLLLLCVILNLVFARSMIYFITLMRTFQMMIHLPMIKIMVPGCVIYFFAYIFPIVQWDIFKDGMLDSREWFLNKDDDLSGFLLMDQMKLLGYKSRHMVDSLGSISIFWVIYVSKLLILIGMKRIRKNHDGKTIRKLYNVIFKHCFWQEFFLIVIVLYIEYLIAGYLQFDLEQQKEYDHENTQGAVISHGLMVFFAILTLGIIPLIFLYLLSQNVNMYQQQKFNVRWGSLFEGVQLRTKSTAAFYLIFIMRRLLFVCIVFKFEHFPCLSVIFICYMNLGMLIYTGMFRPLQQQRNNRLEMFNELFVCFVTLHMFVFTDWVHYKDGSLIKETQYLYGISMNCFVAYYLYFNLAVIMFSTFFQLKLVLIKYYRLIKFHYVGLGGFELPNDCNELPTSEPLDIVMSKRNLKVVLQHQFQAYVQQIEQPAPIQVLTPKKKPPINLVVRPQIIKERLPSPKTNYLTSTNRPNNFNNIRKNKLSTIQEEDPDQSLNQSVHVFNHQFKKDISKKYRFASFMDEYTDQSNNIEVIGQTNNKKVKIEPQQQILPNFTDQRFKEVNYSEKTDYEAEEEKNNPFQLISPEYSVAFKDRVEQILMAKQSIYERPQPLQTFSSVTPNTIVSTTAQSTVSQPTFLSLLTRLQDDDNLPEQNEEIDIIDQNQQWEKQNLRD